MAHYLSERVADSPDDLAVADDRSELSWSELDNRVNQLVHGLRRLGANVGDTLSLVAENRHEWLEVALATSHCGIRMVPVNFHLAADEMAYIFENSSSSVVVCDHGHLPVVRNAVDSLDAEITLIVIEGSAGDHVEYEALLAAETTDEPDEQTAGTLLPYTSGTTGFPKGVVSTIIPTGVTVEVMKTALQMLASVIHLPVGKRLYVNAPLYHAGPFGVGVIGIALGSSVILQARFDPERTLSTIEERGVEGFYAVPTMFNRLLRLPDEVKDEYDISSLQWVWHTAAPVSPDVKRAMIEWWGPVLNELYGGTDSAGGATFCTSEEWLAKPGTVGKANPGTELLILDDDGKPLGPGEAGTIYFRNLSGADVEYLGDPEKTAAAHLEPGVVTLGDVGYVDDDGYLFLTDRKIDMIVSGGVNIYPAEIEQALLNHPSVQDVAVFGVPHDDFGEEVKAVVQPATGAITGPALADDIMGYCRGVIAHYKCPRTVDFLDDFPRTPTGKLQKRKLRDPYWEGRDRGI